MTQSRPAEIAVGLRAVLDRIERACASAGRDPAGVRLVVVTKSHPADDIRALAALGQRDIGENRDAEAAGKAAACADLDLRWHFVGQLQTNKARSVARYAAVVHSVDRLRLVGALGAGARSAGRQIDCLVQVRLDRSPGRGGAMPEALAELADAVATEGGLDLRGVMAIAPLGADPREAFARLAEIAADLRARHPLADVVSAGMSGDLEAAVAAGATHLRVGSAVLGPRRTLR